MSTNKQNDDGAAEYREAQLPKESDDALLSKIRLPQNFGSIIGGHKVTQYIAVQKPPKQSFVRTHASRDMWLETGILDFQEEREAYIVEKQLFDELANEIQPKVLIPSITAQGHLFIWPIKLPAENGQIDEWNRTALLAAQLAQEKWVRVSSNRFTERGFQDRVIGSTDHLVIRRLRGEL
jgi:hypothetical protein